MYGVLIVNKHRYLINMMVSDHVQDMDCKRILKQFPEDAIVDWCDTPTREDLGY